jgi:Fe-S cluster biogenesis protein NfuA
MDGNPTIISEPVDESRWLFIADRPLHGDGERRFTSCEEAGDVPIAEALLEIAGVEEVVLRGNSVLVTKQADSTWPALEERIRYAIGSGVSGAQDVPGSDIAPADDDAMFEVAAEVFQSHINPTVASHGGKVELIDVQDGTVIVRLQGGCQGCGMANVTLKQGIEGSLRRVLPSLRGVEDITDHSAGTNPYFSAQKK